MCVFFGFLILGGRGTAGASDLNLSNPRPFLAEPRQRAVILAESRATPTVQKKEELGKRKMEKRRCMNAVHAETPSRSFPCLAQVSSSEMVSLFRSLSTGTVRSFCLPHMQVLRLRFEAE